MHTHLILYQIQVCEHFFFLSHNHNHSYVSMILDSSFYCVNLEYCPLKSLCASTWNLKTWSWFYVLLFHSQHAFCFIKKSGPFLFLPFLFSKVTFLWAFVSFLHFLLYICECKSNTSLVLSCFSGFWDLMSSCAGKRVGCCLYWKCPCSIVEWFESCISMRCFYNYWILKCWRISGFGNYFLYDFDYFITNVVSEFIFFWSTVVLICPFQLNSGFD